MRTRAWAGLLSLFLLAGGVTPAGSQTPEPAGFPRLDSARAFELLVTHSATPEALALHLRRDFIFRNDPDLFGQVDYWQTPEEFLAQGQGDCEDYALLAAAVLKRQGIKAFVFSLYGKKGYAHTVCVFVEEGLYSVINQDRLIRCRAQSLQELAGRLCSRWEWGAVAERAGHRGRAVIRIERL